MIKKKVLISMFLAFMTICWSCNICTGQEQGEAKVSITLWPEYRFTDTPDLDSILIKGSWIGDAGGQFVYNGTPIVNTIDIYCNKSDKLFLQMISVPCGFI